MAPTVGKKSAPKVIVEYLSPWCFWKKILVRLDSSAKSKHRKKESNNVMAINRTAQVINEIIVCSHIMELTQSHNTKYFLRFKLCSTSYVRSISVSHLLTFCYNKFPYKLAFKTLETDVMLGPLN